MDLVLPLSLCCSWELALEAGCALPFEGAVPVFYKMVQLSSVCILLLILNFVSLVTKAEYHWKINLMNHVEQPEE